VASKEKELGFLIMKLFKQFFRENETKWMQTVGGLRDYIEQIRKDKEFLLGKFKASPGVSVGIHCAKQVVQNEEVSYENLVSHKALINQIIGEYFNLEDESFHETFRLKNLTQQTNDLIVGWDSIRSSEKVKQSIMEISPKTIMDTLLISDEYRK
jgi:hypothetical protein